MRDHMIYSEEIKQTRMKAKMRETYKLSTPYNTYTLHKLTNKENETSFIKRDHMIYSEEMIKQTRMKGKMRETYKLSTPSLHLLILDIYVE